MVRQYAGNTQAGCLRRNLGYGGLCQGSGNFGEFSSNSLVNGYARAPGGGVAAFWELLWGDWVVRVMMPGRLTDWRNAALMRSGDLSNRLCEGHAYKLFYHPVLHIRPILLDRHTWARTIRYGFL